MHYFLPTLVSSDIPFLTKQMKRRTFLVLGLFVMPLLHLALSGNPQRYGVDWGSKEGTSSCEQGGGKEATLFYVDSDELGIPFGPHALAPLHWCVNVTETDLPLSPCQPAMKSTGRLELKVTSGDDSWKSILLTANFPFPSHKRDPRNMYDCLLITVPEIIEALGGTRVTEAMKIRGSFRLAAVKAQTAMGNAAVGARFYLTVRAFIVTFDEAGAFTPDGGTLSVFSVYTIISTFPSSVSSWGGEKPYWEDRVFVKSGGILEDPPNKKVTTGYFLSASYRCNATCPTDFATKTDTWRGV